MYKVVTSQQMAEIERYAYHGGCSEEKFMEEAGQGVAQCVAVFCEKHSLPKTVTLLCGKGNNGGDAYVAGCYLLKKGFKVNAFQVGQIEQCSALCKKNQTRFYNDRGTVIYIESANDLSLNDTTLIVDALFGTGLKQAPREPYASIIEKANASKVPILAVDIPSGLNGDTGDAEGSVIEATATIFLGLPKKGFFLHEGWNAIGKLQYVDFGLPKHYIDEISTAIRAFNENDFLSIMPRIRANRHKYEAGYVVGLAGSPGMPGAANLSAAGALRGGAGIVRLLYPKGMEAELSSSMYELIKTPYDCHDPESLEPIMNRAGALFIGPGLSVTEETRSLLKKLLPLIEIPTVLDADALNILSENKISLPKDVVMTPHIGEMRRLLGSKEKGAVDEQFLQQCQEYVERKKVTLLLKGGPSFILHPGADIVVNPYGDPGMATAGSGDVLTGLVAALLSQGLSTHNAAMTGAYIHARAGEYAAEAMTSYCMVASDIIDNFPKVFGSL